MYIKKIIIENFKCFEGKFSLDFNKCLNILVGDNEAGKSTILEAIHLALSGWIYGRYIGSELTQALFNNKVIKQYLDSIGTKNQLQPPRILIELFFDIKDIPISATFEGMWNSLKEKACGIQFQIFFNEKYKNEYNLLVSGNEKLNSLPIEYYEFSWSSFAGDDRLTPKSIPIKSALIDSSSNRNQNGSDIYISRIIRDLLSEEHIVKVSQAHRKLKDNFAKDDAIKAINAELEQKQISDKRVELSIDVSTKTAWENTLTTYLDGIPFSYAGRGEQSMVKTKLALSHQKSKEANILLLEEPENHLSHAKLNKFVNDIKADNSEKQIIISTHSSFVANKLGLSSLILLNVDKVSFTRGVVRIKDLTEDTKKYFEKLSGYDTLRLVLCKKAILVEGPSDELVVQKAYHVKKGKLPIEDEVEVISVGISFKRFLEIAKIIKKPVAVVTDNDGNYEVNIKKKYEQYANTTTIKICADKRDDLNTLEPQIIDVNKDQIKILTNILGVTLNATELCDYMQKHKTDWALKIFDTSEGIKFPQYILDAIE
ncbi:MAG: AAA family ATPase [Dehalococcoidales bacterium]|nr:AAA family ATPase [Dehalococcoidales bacterium]